MKRIILVFSLVLVAASLSYGDEGDPVTWSFLNSPGLEMSISGTGIYNANVRGGTSTHRRQGRWSGSYDIELWQDLSRLCGFENAGLYMHAEGGWSRSGINDTSVGSFFGTNTDFIGRKSINLIEMWYQQSFLDDEFRVRLGKLDITGGFECRGCPVSFDGNAYANDETSQFLNGSLVNNPTIPFPDYGIGAVGLWSPGDFWYASFGVVDAQADGRETGFNTAFSGEDYYFYIAETGITPKFDSSNGSLQGAYRFGVWNDPQPKAATDGAKKRRDDVGFYVSCDQMITKENDNPEDTQGLGAFFRYGYADSSRNSMTNFFSGGLQYQGPFDGRDEDVAAIGFSHGTFSDKATDYTQDYESVFEVYYNAKITDSFNLTPSVQYVSNPGGVSAVSDAVVLAVRAQMNF